jgi:hypothetical protein
MKYLISQEQQELIANAMAKIIKSHFSESTWICDITVFPTESDEDEAIFDIYIHLKLSQFKQYNEYGQKSIALSIKHKVQGFVEMWFTLKSDDFFIGTLLKDC